MSPVNCLFLAKPLLSNLIGTGLKKAVKKWLPFFASIRDECDNRWSLTKTRYKNGSTRSHHKEINLRRVTVKLWSSLQYSTSSFLLYTHTHTFVLTFAYNMTLLHLLTGNYIPILYGFFPFITLHDK